MKRQFLAGLIWSLVTVSAAAAQPDAAALKGGLLVGGTVDAPVRIEIFSCYQCPPCRDFYLDTVRPLLKEYARTNKVSVIYYEYPLKIHNHSRDSCLRGIEADCGCFGVSERISPFTLARDTLFILPTLSWFSNPGWNHGNG